MNNLIDSHFHLLELKKRGIEPQNLLQELDGQDFAGGMDIGVSEDDIDERLSLTAPYPRIRCAAGIGPWGAQGDEPIEPMVSRFAHRLEGNMVDSIGEIGLDYHWNYGTPERQKELFRRQMALADTRSIPIVIHSRSADWDMIEELKRAPLPRGGILHCFSSSWELAKTALDRGLHISFAGPITYRKNDELRAILARIPLDRLLLETDSPYLSPEPYRGKINTPFTMREIYQKAAEVTGTSVEALAEQLIKNFDRLVPIHRHESHESPAVDQQNAKEVD